MAREFANTAGSPNIDYITYSAVPPVANLATCSIVARLSGDSDAPNYANAITASSPSYINDVSLLRSGAANTIAACFRNGGSGPMVTFPFTFDGTMRSVIFTYNGPAAPNCVIGYLDGVSQTLGGSTVNGTIGTGQTAFLVGGVAGFRWNGKIAEAAIYNRVITAAEAAMHGAGYSCMHFPRGLIFYAPLIREVGDIVGGLTGTITGTTVADHPRIYL